MQVYHLFRSEIPTDQTCSDQSHFLEAGSAEPSWLACAGMLVTAVIPMLHDALWQACNYVQAQEAKVLFSVERNEPTVTFLFI